MGQTATRQKVSRHGRTLESAMVIVLDGLNSGIPGACRAQPFSTLSRGHGKS